jgi:hypothetical protein
LESVVIPKADAPAVNTAAVITLAADASTRHVVDKVFGGYDATPTGGLLTIALTVLGSAVSLVVPLPVAEPFDLDFIAPLQGDLNTAITLTLAAGGNSVTGKLNALTR